MLGLKKIAARSFQRLVLASGLVGLWVHSTYAQPADGRPPEARQTAAITAPSEPTVLLLEPAAAPSGLLTALQIQLSGLTTARRVSVELPKDAAEAIDRGGRLVRAEHALAAVWVEHPAGRSPAVIYLVGDREGRALIEVVRVSGDRGPELDRAVALKVRELVAAVQRGQVAQPEAAQLLRNEPEPQLMAAAAAEASNAGPEDALPPAPSWSALAFAGLRLGSQPAFGLGRWGFGLGAGPVLHLGALRGGIQLGFDVFPSVSAERLGDRVRFWEWSAGATVHAQLRAGSLWVGGRAGPQRVGLNATGFTQQGNTGSASPTAWALCLGLDLELPLSGSLSLNASLQLQALANRLHLDVNDATLVDLGRLRAHIGADVLARF